MPSYDITTECRNVKKNRLFAEARYVLGLTNINDESGASNESTVKTRGLQILIGATIPIGT